MDARRKQAQELRRQIEWTLARAIDPGDVLPMLHRLARLAHEGSDDSIFANLRLAELLVDRDPWRAAVFARRVVLVHPEDDRGWATLALCQTLLRNYKFAVSAYQRALTSAPKNPWYAHNLGHLLDVALGRSSAAVGWLKRAYQSEPESGDVASSYAHALARAGRIAEARKVLTRAMKRGSSREHAALLRWVEQGAPSDKDHPLPRPAPVHTIDGRRGQSAANSAEAEGEPRARDKTEARTNELVSDLANELERVLALGLARLPLDGKQRARAKSLARDAREGRTATNGPKGTNDLSRPTGRRAARARSPARAAVEPIAAAIAYAIVYVDHVPLTQAEVAACFRVSVASLRARFGELRSHLDLLPGDARYATLRRN